MARGAMKNLQVPDSEIRKFHPHRHALEDNAITRKSDSFSAMPEEARSLGVGIALSLGR